VKKKILFIITKSENGGAQTWVKEQIDILKDSYRVYIATDEEGWLIKASYKDDYMVDKRIKKIFSFSYLYKLSKFIKKHKIDLIVANTANAGVYGRLSQLFYETKVIYVGHGWSSIYNGGKLTFVYTAIERYLSYITDSVLCVSDSDYKKAYKNIGIDRKKLKLIKNKILPLKRADFSNRDSGQKERIVMVARFRNPKRQDLIVKAIKKMDNAELYLVGDGPTKREFEHIDSEKIHFLGEVDGFDEFYKYDIFALISDSEGLPLSAVEAMSAGLPLVLSNVGGCPELIDGNGVLVDNSVDSIVKGLQEAIDKKLEFSKRSLEIFDQEFNLEKFSKVYLDYYGTILDSKTKSFFSL
jgi:glycosyltransferase involved in cell wall biosynthesis